MVDGGKVKRWRLTRGLNQRELAAKSGVTLDAISGIEQGKRQPQPRTITLLADALDVEPEALLADSSTMSSMLLDGSTLWRYQRPKRGWTYQDAQAIDDAVLRLVRQLGMEHVYVWLARDAADAVLPFLKYNMMLRAPGVATDYGPRGTETDYCIALYKSDPSADRPAFTQRMMEEQGLVPRKDVEASSEEN